MNRVSLILGAIFFSTIGILIGKTIDWPFFSIEKNINLVDVLSIIVTSYLAFYVVEVLEKKGTEDRHEKDLILKRIEELDSILQQCNIDISDGEILYTDASAYFGKSTVLVNRIFTMITIASLECDLQYQNQLINAIRIVRNLSTNTPRISNSNPNITPDLVVNNGIITISSNRVYELDQQFEDIKTIIFRFQVGVNRS